ncbi:class I SAM-dependent methyltransferase [Streptomyces carpaticus]|uniref:class I SAM-dependent methyltransferase n=1 Tax=Streptomyces carpaticus TaxID=285558 RepID=UPI0022090562|nr:class I SAM-dependent methyltransferase [Streptomyces carpaticus]
MELAGQEEYRVRAGELARAYEGVRFEDVHRDVVAFLPGAGARVLDVGAGSGRDAAALAGRGYRVAAVEPTDALREVARRLHPEPGIEWVDSALPEVGGVSGPFALVLLSAVWMHLDQAERGVGMARLAELVEPAGRVVITLRHGPPPAGRRMFEVSGDETVALAAEHGLVPVHRGSHPDRMGRAEVSWTVLVFER